MKNQNIIQNSPDALYTCNQLGFIKSTAIANAAAATYKALERYGILSKATSDTIWYWDIVNNRMTYNDVQNHFNGEVAIESTAGNGCRLWVNIPY